VAVEQAGQLELQDIQAYKTLVVVVVEAGAVIEMYQLTLRQLKTEHMVDQV
jgi:hypothetical protein